MKRIISLVLLCMPVLTGAQTPFWQQTSGPTGNYADVRTLAINSQGHIFAGTWNTGLFRTTDNGITWVRVASMPNPVLGLCIRSDATIFAAIYGGGVFRSTDDGATWTQAGLASAQARSVFCAPSGSVFAATSSGVFRSTDNCASWEQVISNINASTFSANSQGQMFAGSVASGLFRSTDNGYSWSAINNGLNSPSVIAPTFSSTGIALTAAGPSVYRSTDNGDSWVPASSGLPADITALIINSNDIAVATTIDSSTSYSWNFGNSWLPVPSGGISTRIAVLARDSSDYLVAGTLGAGVFRTSRSTLGMFGPPQKHIIATAGPHGTITPGDTVSVDSGSTQKFTFVPDPGYCTDSVFVDAGFMGPGASYTFYNVITDHTIRVTFRTAALHDGLAAYYPFNGNANDESGNGNHGAVNGATLTSDRFGHTNCAYHFNGQSYIAVPETFTADVAGFTMSAWAKPDFVGGSEGHSVFYKGSQQGEGNIGITGVHFACSVKLSDFTWYGVTANDTPAANRYYHIVARYRRGVSLDLWVNGVLSSSRTLPAIDLITYPGYYSSIGADHQTLFDCWQGDIDDIRIYDRALSPTEIDSLSHERPGITLQCQVFISWNLLSVPLSVADPRKSSIFPTAVSDAYAYTPSGYGVRDTLQNGLGYWLKFSAAQNVAMTGTMPVSDTIAVTSGWNMMGSVSYPTAITDIQQLPSIIVVSEYYGYRGGYSFADTIYPGKGYWVKTSGPGQLVLPSPGMQSKAGPSLSRAIDNAAKITLFDAGHSQQTLCFTSKKLSAKELDRYELPPLPPAGVFDVRFATNRMLEAVNGGEVRTIPIQVTSAEYPLTISWDMKSQPSDASLMIGDREVKMNGMGTATVTDPEASIALKLGGEPSLPKEFALAQNYPNPFNPVTTIKYDLPIDTRVTLRILNILGQEVETLVSGEEKAGYRSVEWNASHYASGVYFYRLEAGSFTSVRKLLLLK